MSKAADANLKVQAILTSARRRDAQVVVSAVTLAEVLRGGGRDAAVHRVLSRVSLLPISPKLGRQGGELLGSTGSDATVDALVAVTALDQVGPVLILTSDPGDLRALTAARIDVAVERV